MMQQEQSVQGGSGNNRCLVGEPNSAHKHALWAQDWVAGHGDR